MKNRFIIETLWAIDGWPLRRRVRRVNVIERGANISLVEVDDENMYVSNDSVIDVGHEVMKRYGAL